jgi:hypothetical protein
MKKALALSSILLAIILHSCKKDPVGPSINVTPSNLQIVTIPDGLTEFRIKLNQGDNPGLNVQILAKPENSVTSTVLDTTIIGATADFYWVYQAPSSGVEDVILTFRVFDNDGISNSTLRRMIIEGNALLEQTTGHLLYSGYNVSSLNGFDISAAEPLNLASLADSSGVDLIEFDLEDDEELSYSFSSYSGIKFIRNNDFNYAEATNQSAMDSYESSTPQSIISNVNVDDIIIAKYDTVNSRYAVIRVVGINDAAGTNADRYEFNLKK